MLQLGVLQGPPDHTIALFSAGTTVLEHGELAVTTPQLGPEHHLFLGPPELVWP